MENQLKLSNDLKESLDEFAKAECLKEFVKDFKQEFGESIEPIAVIDYYVEFVKVLKRTFIVTKRLSELVKLADTNVPFFNGVPNLDHLKSNTVLVKFNGMYKVTFGETLETSSGKLDLPEYLNRLVYDFFKYSFFKKFAINFVPESEFEKTFPEHLFNCKIPTPELV